jgi:serine/threonine-protein kinase
MSSVYAGVHRNGHRVAIKILSPELTANRQARERFLREGYVANRVGHEGAVRVLDDDVAEGDVVFLVMELLDGETFAARAQRLGAKLPPSEVIFAMADLLAVLTSAHANGVVHRDIKPANVFLTRAGRIKLLDFGIASLKEMSGGSGSTRPGSHMGTPGFMAPEQARGRWEAVDERTDLWSVGATMFRLLAGRLVHGIEGENEHEAVIAAATVPAPSLGSIEPGLPPALVAFVDRALLPNPDQRWQSAAQMREALVEVGRGLTPPIWRVPAPRELSGRPVLDATKTEAPIDAASPAWSTPAPAAVVPAPRRVGLGGRGLLVLGAGLAVAAAAGLWLRPGRIGPTPAPWSIQAAGTPPSRGIAADPAPEPSVVPPGPVPPGGSPVVRPLPDNAGSPPTRHRRRAGAHRASSPDPVVKEPSTPNEGPGAPPAVPPLHQLLNERR